MPLRDQPQPAVESIFPSEQPPALDKNRLVADDWDQLFQEKNTLTYSIIETSQAILLVLDVQGRIVFFNSYFEKLTGYTLDEVRGQSWFALFIPSVDQDKISHAFKCALASAGPYAEINPIVTKDGRERLIGWNNQKLFDAQQNLLGLFCFGRDITDEKRYETFLGIQRDFALMLSSFVSLEQNLQLFLQILVRRTEEISSGCIHLFEPDSGELRCAVHEALDPDTLNPFKYFPASSSLLQAVRQGLIQYLPADTFAKKYILFPQNGICSCALIPIKFNDVVLGSLFLFSKKIPDFPQDLRHFLEIMSSMLGAAILQSLTLDEMRESESKHRTIFETSADAMMLLDEKNFLDCNQATLRMFRLAGKTDFIGVHPSKLSPPFQPNGEDSMRAASQHIQLALQKGGHRFSWVYRRSTGEDFPAEIQLTAFLLQNRYVLQATVRDVSEQEQAQQHLQKSLEVQSALNELVSLSLENYFADETFSKIIFHLMSVPWLKNTSACALFLVHRGGKTLKLHSQRGLSIQQLAEYDYIPVDAAQALPNLHTVSAVINPPAPIFDHLYIPGRETLFLLPLKNHQNILLGLVALVSGSLTPLDPVDESFFFTANQIISSLIQRKQADEQFNAAYARMDHLIHSIPTILIAIDKDNCITQWNHTAEKLLGLSVSQVLHRPFPECPIPWEWREAMKKIPSILYSYKPLRFENIRFTTPDKREGFLDITVTPIRGSLRQFSEFLIVASDRTQQKILESQLLQSQKLESIGQLAAGIAHEINTPIQYVGDNIRFLQDSFSNLIVLLEQISHSLADGTQALAKEQTTNLAHMVADLDLEYLLTEIPSAILQSLDGVERVATIVRAMKGFAHPDSSQEKVLSDLNQGIENTITIARNEWKYVAEVEARLAPDLPLVPCLPGEINQVVLNLIINASHAIAESLGDKPATKGKITVSTQAKGPWAEIHISDTGCGIPMEIQNKIFDPFFTTKKVGKGTGQGLTISRSVIVDKHQGTIHFETQPGQGTTFIIRLPLLPPNPEADPHE